MTFRVARRFALTTTAAEKVVVALDAQSPARDRITVRPALAK